MSKLEFEFQPTKPASPGAVGLSLSANARLRRAFELSIINYPWIMDNCLRMSGRSGTQVV
jgi:hypothetical protein